MPPKLRSTPKPVLAPTVPPVRKPTLAKAMPTSKPSSKPGDLWPLKLAAFYTKYNPGEMQKVETIIKAGKPESTVLLALFTKYALSPHDQAYWNQWTKPQTPNVRDATVTFGAGYGDLPLPIHRRIVQYLHRNCYTPLIGDATLVPLRGTTSRALHDEVMAIGAPFNLVLTDLGEGDIMDGFLEGCKHVVSCSIHAPKITRIGYGFLVGCTSLLT